MSIIDQIDKNKEWLFSGIGVAIGGLILNWIRRRMFPDKQHSPAARVVAQGSDSPALESRDQSTPPAVASVKKTSGVEFSKILSVLRNAPPLQKADVVKHYVGINVQWETRLWSADKDDKDNVRLSLDVDSKETTLVHCSVRLSDYRELGVMERGAPITVIGKISAISTLWVDLEDVQLFFHDTSSVAP